MRCTMQSKHFMCNYGNRTMVTESNVANTNITMVMENNVGNIDVTLSTATDTDVNFHGHSHVRECICRILEMCPGQLHGSLSVTHK